MPHTVFAADLGGTKIAAALLTHEGKFLARKTEAVDLSSRLAPVQQILRLAREVGGKFTIRAAGIAVPGLVRGNRTVWAPNLPGWDKVPLEHMLRKRLQITVEVESDRNAAVLGEGWRGAGRGKTDVIVLLVGTGIGAGILSGGEVLRGAHELSGCAGWMAVSEADGDDVRRHGGLEAFACGPALVRAAVNSIEAGFGGKMAGLPASVVTRAQEILAGLERDEASRGGRPTLSGRGGPSTGGNDLMYSAIASRSFALSCEVFLITGTIKPPALSPSGVCPVSRK